MKFFISFYLSLITSSLTCQEHANYIIKINKDTVYTKSFRIDKKMRSVVCEKNDKKVRYQAKEVLLAKCDTVLYEVGCVRFKGAKQFLFLRRTVTGDLCLYEINSKRTQVIMTNIGNDLIHLRWVFRAQHWGKKIPFTIYFYKKVNESNTHFSRSWKEKTQDCKLMHDKLKSKITAWTPSEKELVQFYNLNCD